MPKITKVFELDVPPEKYVESCDIDELQEVYLLASARLEREQQLKYREKDKKSELKGKRKILKNLD